MSINRHPVSGLTDAQIWAGSSTDSLRAAADEYEAADADLDLGPIAERLRHEIARREDHGPGCDGPLNCTCPVPDRDETIAIIRTELKRRSGKAWSVTGGRGTVWGWITVTAPPARRDRFGAMSDADRVELSALLGTEVHHQGESIPAGSSYRREYIDRARGVAPSVVGTPYWD